MHSQNLEEQHILNYFGDFVGTFCDLGSNDGETFSNTRALALKGWKGVLVDCSPPAVARCEKLYKDFKDIYVYDYAIHEHNAKKIFDDSGPLCTPSDIGLVGTFHKHEKARFDRKVKYTPVEVKTFKWKTAVNRWKIREFDMMSIDIEGSEIETDKNGNKYSILSYMDLTKTRLLCIETNGNKEFQMLHEKYLDGFTVIYTSAENIVYARI